MKVGMDALLLGSWVEPPTTGKILDVGTGCGILALMMASKSQSTIDAVELDRASAREAEKNFYCSPFHRRLKVINDNILSFADQTKDRYDLIITNPPFFDNKPPSVKTQQARARHTNTLNYEQLVTGCIRMMNGKSRLCLVLPYEESKTFIQTAESHRLYLQKQMLIFPIRGHLPNRVNLQLGLTKWDKVDIEKFVVREEDLSFSQNYYSLLGDFLIGKTNQ
jgi:tRNA1Val (adenine37-N6)-methyltransferase